MNRAMLLGSPRSGTTWLAKIIDSHPQVLYRHEPDSINVRQDIPFVPLDSELQSQLAATRDYVDFLFSERAGKSAGSQPMFRKAYRSLPAEWCRSAIIYGLKVGERLAGSDSVFPSVQIPDMARLRGRDDVLYFMKSVSSLCRARLITQALPGTRIVHILRHPCAYVASTLRGNRLGLLNDDAYIETLAAMPESQPFGLDLQTLRGMSLEQQLAARWMLQNGKVMQEMAQAGDYRLVVYEDLCADPLQVATELFAFLGLELGQQSRDFIADSSGGKAGEVRYFDVKRDSAAAASGWMKELDASQIAQISDVVRDSAPGQIYFRD